MDNRINNREEKNRTYLIIGGVIVLALALAYVFFDDTDEDVRNVSPAAGEVTNQSAILPQNSGE